MRRNYQFAYFDNFEAGREAEAKERSEGDEGRGVTIGGIVWFFGKWFLIYSVIVITAQQILLNGIDEGKRLCAAGDCTVGSSKADKRDHPYNRRD
jgi:hypothetical protein